MTKNEAKRISNESLNNVISVYKTTIDIVEKNKDSDYCPALDKVVVALLEELKAYRATGLSPTMVKDLIESCKKHEKNALENVHIVDEYQAIGTIDEFKALKEKDTPKKLLLKWDMYPTNHGIYSASDRWCPNCKALVFDGDWDNCRQRIMYGKYRCSCGQKLDWSE